jgi:UDP-2,3-diacylglucosamine pyrophosphatase LpxH/biotin operon repressor
VNKIKENLQEVLKGVVELHTQNKRKDWKAICEEMREAFPNERNTKERWRSMYRKVNNPKWAKQARQGTQKRDDKRVNRFKTKERILAQITKKRNMKYLEEKLGLARDLILRDIMELRLDGYNIEGWRENGNEYYQNIKVVEVNKKEYEHLYAGREIKIALVSDTHMGHKVEAVKELKEFYDYAYNAGVREFYHAGDLSDGNYSNRKNHQYEVHKRGHDEQKEWIVEQYPKIKGVTTYFITGNHDATHMMNGGANIGKNVAAERDDMIYLGHNFAKIWLTEQVDLNLFHPSDGSAYGVSLKAQKIVDGATGARKCKILAIGHYHKMNWIYWKDTHAFIMPSFQHQTDFMSGRGLKSYVGGYILNIKVDKDGKMISIMPEFVEL